MSLKDKVSHAVEDLKGKAKETTGAATDNNELRAEGKRDQSKSDLKQAGEHVKDAIR